MSKEKKPWEDVPLEVIIEWEKQKKKEKEKARPRIQIPLGYSHYEAPPRSDIIEETEEGWKIEISLR